jgi:hypothetical protein
MVWKEGVVTQFIVISWHMVEEIEETYEKYQSR